MKWHRSPRASVAFYRVQKLIQGPMDMNTEENVVLADALPKKRLSAAKISEISYYSQHCWLLYSRVHIWLFAVKCGLFVHITFVILLPISMTSALIMATALCKTIRSALPTIV